MKKFMISAAVVVLCAAMGVGFSNRPSRSQPSADSVPVETDNGRNYGGKRRCSCCNQKLPRSRWFFGSRSSQRQNRRNDR